MGWAPPYDDTDSLESPYQKPASPSINPSMPSLKPSAPSLESSASPVSPLRNSTLLEPSAPLLEPSAPTSKPVAQPLTNTANVAKQASKEERERLRQQLFPGQNDSKWVFISEGGDCIGIYATEAAADAAERERNCDTIGDEA